MKLSLDWLGDHVDLSGISPEEIAEQLTMRIALIEGIERPSDALRDVKVGAVLECADVPKSDHLHHCKVDDGTEVREVVCGAPNVAAGQRIAYAPPGAVLAGGLRLGKKAICGIESHGMICSERELGLGEDHDGILVLDPGAVPGTPVLEVLGDERRKGLDDVLLDIDNKTVTHRGDLWGHHGFARELAAIFGRTRHPLDLAEDLHPDPDAVAIRLEDPEGCPVYLGLRIEGVPGDRPSPEWVARRLRAADMRPINLLVDLSNYVMLETGQPTHPFDHDTLEGGVVVRRARAGEVLRTLDEVDRKLDPEDLVIADQKRVIAIAGIMGGGPTEVSAGTQRVLLESAHFDGISVRRTSSRLGLRTDALARFEKFLDPRLTEVAVRRYAALLRRIEPSARIAPAYGVAGEAQDRSITVPLRADRARAKLGYALSTEEMADRLRSIDFGVEVEGEVLQVQVPGFRGGRDVQHEDDLIEEVGRLAGYDRIPAVLPRVACTPPHIDPVRRLESRAIRTMVHECGYVETLNYSFATDAQVAAYHAEDEPFLGLPHPITKDARRLRRSLVPGLLQQAAANQLHREEIRLAEVGRSYLPELGDEELPHERHELAAVRLDTRLDGESLLFELRSDAESLVRRLRLTAEAGAPEGTLPRFAHPTRCIEWRLEGRPVLWAAELHPELMRPFDIECSAAVLMADLGALAAVPCIVPRMSPLPQFPSVRRDLSLLSPLEVSVGSILDEIRTTDPRHIAHVELFDVYRGKGIPEGHRSLAFRVEYRDPARTLTDKDVESMQAEVVRRLEGRGLQLRG